MTPQPTPPQLIDMSRLKVSKSHSKSRTRESASFSSASSNDELYSQPPTLLMQAPCDPDSSNSSYSGTQSSPETLNGHASSVTVTVIEPVVSTQEKRVKVRPALAASQVQNLQNKAHAKEKHLHSSKSVNFSLMKGHLVESDSAGTQSTMSSSSSGSPEYFQFSSQLSTSQIIPSQATDRPVKKARVEEAAKPEKPAAKKLRKEKPSIAVKTTTASNVLSQRNHNAPINSQKPSQTFKRLPNEEMKENGKNVNILRNPLSSQPAKPSTQSNFQAPRHILFSEPSSCSGGYLSPIPEPESVGSNFQTRKSGAVLLEVYDWFKTDMMRRDAENNATRNNVRKIIKEVNAVSQKLDKVSDEMKTVMNQVELVSQKLHDNMQMLSQDLDKNAVTLKAVSSLFDEDLKQIKESQDANALKMNMVAQAIRFNSETLAEISKQIKKSGNEE